MKQQDLDKYFSTVWTSKLNQYRYSGWRLLDRVRPHELVLDVGCGFNEFREHMPNLIGIDPANDQADVKVTIELFTHGEKFDVAFCLGSINFGKEDTILNQIACVVGLLKPTARIYWRCNPGFADHDNQACKDIEFYPWTIEKQLAFAEQFGFRCNMICWDLCDRIYAEWTR